MNNTSIYTNGSGYFVAVVTAAPGAGSMQVGIGESADEARESLVGTPIASHLSALDGLRWACEQEDGDAEELYDAMYSVDADERTA